MASDHDLSAGDSLMRIEINPPLPCGISGCGRPAHCARIERDLRYDSLWRLLPICEAHLRSLDAAAGRSIASEGVSRAVSSSAQE
ncbi:MAG TPA: hypothetical protein VE338_14080 [Ktedonobacterales bacterium]|jgi:hypothetical protein|nr:hypothetical protein [Ktedonobacterales bacterium]